MRRARRTEDATCYVCIYVTYVYARIHDTDSLISLSPTCAISSRGCWCRIPQNRYQHPREDPRRLPEVMPVASWTGKSLDTHILACRCHRMQPLPDAQRHRTRCEFTLELFICRTEYGSWMGALGHCIPWSVELPSKCHRWTEHSILYTPPNWWGERVYNM